MFELLGQLGGRGGVGHVLLICQHQEDGVPQTIILEHVLQLLSGLAKPFTIARVDYEDECVVVFKVVSP